MGNRTDNFNRADSTTALGTPSDSGGDWTANAGTWGIASNTGYSVGTGTLANATLESSLANVNVFCTMPTVASHGLGLVARLTDNSNYILGVVDSGNTWRTYKKVAGGYTQLGSTGTSTISNGDKITLSCDGDNIVFKQNTTDRVSTTSTHNNTATKHGIYSSGGNTARYEDFSITEVAAGGATITTTPAIVQVNGVKASLTHSTKVATTPATVLVNGVTTTLSQPITVSATPATVVVNGVTVDLIQPITVSTTPAIVQVNGVTANVGAVTDTVLCTPAVVDVSGVSSTITSSSASSLAGRHVRRGKSRVFPAKALEEPAKANLKPQTGVQATLAQVLTQPVTKPSRKAPEKPLAKVIPIRSTQVKVEPAVVDATPIMKLARQMGLMSKRMSQMAKEMEKIAQRMDEMEKEIVALKEATVESIEDEEDVLLNFIALIA